MDPIELADCPFDWEPETHGDEIVLSIGPWHGHFDSREYSALLEMLETGSLELQLKMRGKALAAARLVRRTDEGEVLIEGFGLLLTPIWRRASYEFYPLRSA